MQVLVVLPTRNALVDTATGTQRALPEPLDLDTLPSTVQAIGIAEGANRPPTTLQALRMAYPQARWVQVPLAMVVAEAAARVPPVAIPIAVSARHVHLDTQAVEVLFGPGHRLTPAHALSQPGQFAAQEHVDIIGPKSTIHGVRAIGPERARCQVEIARTDEFHLGVDAPVRPSGDVKGSPPIRLVGPAGTLDLSEGVICAQRHIHLTPHDAETMGVSDGQLVEVALDTQGRDLIFGDVLVRVSPRYATEMHIDTDEANAAELLRGDEGTLVATGMLGRVRG